MFNKSTFRYAVLVLANAIVVNIHCMQPQNEVVRLKNISAYIGSHAYTPEYSFQERLRKNDLAIKQLVEKTMSPETANALFVNGWGQVLGALLAFQNYNISNNFKTVIEENIEKSIQKANKSRNPFLTVNVREFTKNIMMYPHAGKYYGFKKINIQGPIEHLNEYLKADQSLRFELYEGKLYLRIEPKAQTNIFKKLWENTDFNIALSQSDYNNMEPNKECPHITLINSNIISKIKEEWQIKHTSKSEDSFEEFINPLLTELNETINVASDPIVFTELGYAYSEDYSPFEEVIVAKLKSTCIAESLGKLQAFVKRELESDVEVKKEDAFHITIATKYRKPADLRYETIDELMTDLKIDLAK